MARKFAEIEKEILADPAQRGEVKKEKAAMRSASSHAEHRITMAGAAEDQAPAGERVPADLDQILADLAEIRARVRGPIDAVAVVRDGRDAQPGLTEIASDVVHSMRGTIVDARIGYPQVLHVEIKDSAGELWRLATQDAEWSPSDPARLVGRSVEDADIDEETGELRCKLSDGTLLDVKPAAREAEDDPPNWELITPGGVVLEFGPGVRWQIGSMDSRASSRA
jgi:hypothetical protein